jgi:hypothetical protein
LSQAALAKPGTGRGAKVGLFFPRLARGKGMVKVSVTVPRMLDLVETVVVVTVLPPMVVVVVVVALCLLLVMVVVVGLGV